MGEDEDSIYTLVADDVPVAQVLRTCPKMLNDRPVVHVDFEREDLEKLGAMAIEQQCTVADIIRDEVTTMLAFLDWVKENQDWMQATEPDEPEVA